MEKANGGKNKGICHSCRLPGHRLWACPKKQRCPDCADGFIKWMEVEKTANVGRLFFCCTRDCGFFEWSSSLPDKRGPLQNEGQSSGVKDEREPRCGCTQPKKNLSGLFKTCSTRITEQSNVEISINITFRKGQGDVDANEKQPGQE